MMTRKKKSSHNKIAIRALFSLSLLLPFTAGAQATIDYPVVRLRSLDKVTARTMTFDANVGSTLKFGSIYIKVRACRKAAEMETPEAASFIQVWEVPAGQKAENGKAEWVFSGWMFASSPGLSSMDHPIYDVWVLDCLQNKSDTPAAESEDDQALEGEGEVSEESAPLPGTAPPSSPIEEEIIDSEGMGAADESINAGEQGAELPETTPTIEVSPIDLP